MNQVAEQPRANIRDRVRVRMELKIVRGVPGNICNWGGVYKIDATGLIPATAVTSLRHSYTNQGNSKLADIADVVCWGLDRLASVPYPSCATTMLRTGWVEKLARWDSGYSGEG